MSKTCSITHPISWVTCSIKTPTLTHQKPCIYLHSSTPCPPSFLTLYSQQSQSHSAQKKQNEHCKHAGHSSAYAGRHAHRKGRRSRGRNPLGRLPLPLPLLLPAALLLGESPVYTAFETHLAAARARAAPLRLLHLLRRLRAATHSSIANEGGGVQQARLPSVTSRSARPLWGRAGYTRDKRHVKRT
jgi:hypothetical protein